MTVRKKKTGRKAFSGDFQHDLPKAKREPYRLWFEYLKFALQTAAHRVDQSFYSRWGDVLNSDFDTWWERHWKSLFAVSANVTLITTADAASSALDDSSSILVRVSRAGSETRVIRDFKKLLTAEGFVSTGRHKEKPLYSLTASRSMNLDALRAMLKLLQLLQQHKYIEDATEAYCTWANDWRNGRASGRGTRTIHVPPSLRTFNREIIQHRSVQSKTTRRVKRSDQYNAARGNVARVVRKARKVFANVEKGIFPGTF